MKNVITLGALVISLALIVFLYLRLSDAEQKLAAAEQNAKDCMQVTFQLQNKLTQATRGTAPDSAKVRN
ncbi:hypothetical protein [Hymenobacter psychrotolerans]|uniref:Uncharacterized protein n=1 Tax=Hymenobacter psychrotolerans DSM 18569 TaxID=1121959 RepID=A0A1M6VG06_9BACT|nr:hypothetical protein [Hymenobacter psychrotolerans]SHK80388.1 hypothetical protein SAMN02746009_01596 [Hymenobacter psychrotolerans DSM 18569]